MMKKKAKANKPGSRKSTKKSGASQKDTKDGAEVLKDLSKMVKSLAEKMTEAVIGEGEKGQLATVKFLFEMANIYPQAKDDSATTRDEECLAQTLLRRLDIPESPVVADQYDEDTMVIPAKVSESLQEAAEESVPTAKEEVLV